MNVEAQQRVHELLTELTELLGPAAYPDDPFPDQPAPDQPLWVLDGWVLVASWLEVESRVGFCTRTWSPHLPAHARTGLLHMGLFQFDD